MLRRLTAPPLPRLAALAIDVATYLIIPALKVLLLIQRGVMLSSLAVNALALVLVIAPATGWAARCEARPRGATVGKRLRPLRVIDQKTRALPSGRQALVRNLIKITLPWELGSHRGVGVRQPRSQTCAALALGAHRDHIRLGACKPPLTGPTVRQASA
jgi:uncharacterized RDD family membrane protein YckC